MRMLITQCDAKIDIELTREKAREEKPCSETSYSRFYQSVRKIRSTSTISVFICATNNNNTRAECSESFPSEYNN